MLKIYYADISALNPNAEYSDFSACRLEKLKKMTNENGRKQGIGAELLLLQAVRENSFGISLPLHIKENKYSKPYCDELPFKFSISHSGNISAVAVSEGELGLDVQRISVFNEALCARRFSASEREYIMKSAQKNTAFTEIWTMKESYLKAIGTGLQTPLESFSVIPQSELGVYRINTFALDAYIFSLCAELSFGEPEIINIKF